eukprot:jgi/Chlat1/1097/Chrsp110S01582
MDAVASAAAAAGVRVRRTAAHSVAAVVTAAPFASQAASAPVICSSAVDGERRVQANAVLHRAGSFIALVHGKQPQTVAVRALKCLCTAAAQSPVSSQPQVDQLERGLMVEFKRDSSSSDKNAYALGVVKKPDGKKQWSVEDQYGNLHSVRPQQIICVVPGGPYTAADIASFAEACQKHQDEELLELLWSVHLYDNKSLTPHDLAAELPDSSNAKAFYTAHRMLEDDRLFFKRSKRAGLSHFTYDARPEDQVQALRAAQRFEAEKEQQQAALVDRMRDAMAQSSNAKQSADHWLQGSDAAVILALQQYALESASQHEEDVAQEVLGRLGLAKTPANALSVLTRMGFWSKHVNLALIRSSIPTTFSEDLLRIASEYTASTPDDPDEGRRVDLTGYKAYAIDDSSTLEVDDALSIERLGNGKVRLWIHVADPSRVVRPGDALDTEANRRGTSVYLATHTIPMFPWKLAAGPMSLLQDIVSCAMSVGVVLASDGSIEEYTVTPSRVRVTYRLTYEDVDELLMLGTAEEEDLLLLNAAAQQRLQWRQTQGAVSIYVPQVQPQVPNPDSDEPVITLCDIDSSSPSHQLVAEMMILAGEAVAAFGAEHNLALPYRIQAQPTLPSAEQLELLPSGYARAFAVRSCMTKSDIVYAEPERHASLGLEGYVQFTSPIRRYGDLVAHYQVKAALRGENPPYGPRKLSTLMANQRAGAREAGRVQSETARYWLLEYMRQQSARVYDAIMLKWLREPENLALVVLPQLGLETSMKVTSNLRLGEQFYARLVDANPRKDFLRLQEVSAMQLSKSVST